MPVSPRRSAARAADLEARIRDALASAAAMLRLHDGRLELSAFDAERGVAYLDVAGGCPDCELSVATFSTAVAAHVQQAVPEVREVRLNGA
jgi:Fe-S cluster biogenesis protein NfuA